MKTPLLALLMMMLTNVLALAQTVHKLSDLENSASPALSDITMVADPTGAAAPKKATLAAIKVTLSVPTAYVSSLTAPAAGITVSGSTGAITIGIANDLAALEGLSGTGYAKRTASDTWALITALPWADLTGKPTTLSGYGITDAAAASTTVNGHPLSSNVTVTKSDVSLGNVLNVAQEPAAGNPAGNGYVWTSLTNGTRSWAPPSTFDGSNVSITGGTITGTPISGSTGAFTTLSTTGGAGNGLLQSFAHNTNAAFGLFYTGFGYRWVQTETAVSLGKDMVIGWTDNANDALASLDTILQHPAANFLRLANGSAPQTLGMGPATPDGVLLKQSNGANVSFRNGDDSAGATTTLGAISFVGSTRTDIAETFGGGDIVMSGSYSNNGLYGVKFAFDRSVGGIPAIICGMQTKGLAAAPIQFGKDDAVTYIDGSSITFRGGDVLFAADNTYDIGASASARPRTIYVGTNIIFGAATAHLPLIKGDNGGADSGDPIVHLKRGDDANYADVHVKDVILDVHGSGNRNNTIWCDASHAYYRDGFGVDHQLDN